MGPYMALHAVYQLHKRKETPLGDGTSGAYCEHCTELATGDAEYVTNYIVFPCTTIRTLQGEQ